MQQTSTFENEHLKLREYDIASDRESYMNNLFPHLNSEQGIKELDKWDEWLEDKDQTRVRLVAELNNEIIATCTLVGCMGVKPNDNFTLFSVETSKFYRGSGISQKLFDFCSTWARSKGARILLVETWVNNTTARKFYEKVGFIQFGCLPKGILDRSSQGFVDLIYYYYNL